MKDSSEELQKVSDFYGSDVDKGQPKGQLLVFKSKFKDKFAAKLPKRREDFGIIRFM